MTGRAPQAMTAVRTGPGSDGSRTTTAGAASASTPRRTKAFNSGFSGTATAPARSTP